MRTFGSLLESRHCRIRFTLQIPCSSYLHNLCKYVFSFFQSSIPLHQLVMLVIAQPAKILAWLNQVKTFCNFFFFLLNYQGRHLLLGHLTLSAGWRRSGICSHSSASGASTREINMLLLSLPFDQCFGLFHLFYEHKTALHCQKMLPVQMKKSL